MPVASPEFRQSVVDYYLDGHGVTEIKDAFNVNHETVRRWILAAGHEMRPRGVHVGKAVTTMQVHRSGAAKMPKKSSKPKAAPVDVSQVPRELRRLLPKDLSRVQIVNATTVIVWNSAGQRRQLQTKAAKEHR